MEHDLLKHDRQKYNYSKYVCLAQFENFSVARSDAE